MEISALHTVMHTPRTYSCGITAAAQVDRYRACALGKVWMILKNERAGKQAAQYGATEFLENDAGIVAYLNATLENGDPSLVSSALGDIERSRDMAQRLHAQRRASFSPTQLLRRYP